MHSADVNMPDYAGKTPLHQACQSAVHLSLIGVTFLLRSKAHADALDLNGECPLSKALYSSKPMRSCRLASVVNELLKAQSPIALADNDGSTPLDHAIRLL